MSKCANMAIWAEGCHPSTDDRQPRKRGNERPQHPRKPQQTTHDPAHNAPRRRSKPAPATPPPPEPGARRGLPSGSTPRPRPRGMGDMATRAGVAGGTVIEGVARTRGDIFPGRRERLAVGDEVVNVSGRGVWGFGTIVGVVPPDVWPRVWCKRHGLPLVFTARSGPAFFERYIVRGDDGELHTPRRVVRRCGRGHGR